MGEDKIEQEHLRQAPVLLFVECVDEVVFYPFKTLKALWDFEQDDQSQITQLVKEACN